MQWRKLGLTALEFGPDPEATSGEVDMLTIAERVRRNNLVVANISVQPRLRLLDGDQIDALTQSVQQSYQLARQMRCSILGLLVEEVKWTPGQPWYDYQRDEEQRDLRRRQRDNIVRAVKTVAPIAEEKG